MFGLAFTGSFVDTATPVMDFLRGSVLFMTTLTTLGFYEMKSGSWMINVTAVLGEIVRNLEVLSR